MLYVVFIAYVLCQSNIFKVQCPADKRDDKHSLVNVYTCGGWRREYVP